MAILVVVALSLLTNVYAAPRTYQKFLVMEGGTVHLHFTLDEEQKTIRYVSKGEGLLDSNVLEDYNVGVYADLTEDICFIDIMRRNFTAEVEFLKTSGENITEKEMPSSTHSTSENLRLSKRIALHCKGVCRCMEHPVKLTSVEDCNESICGQDAKCRARENPSDDQFGYECYCSKSQFGNPYGRCFDPITPETCAEVCTSPCLLCPQYPRCPCAGEAPEFGGGDQESEEDAHDRDAELLD
ncbi:uncharacterized protein LOC143041499 [Oratosquilla oratoria]|uniref:uncharacterized protein LOC143041499 n=1 Tax=Oratosquilla oratoria TaxID=337810 RepID=UPI003F75E9DF